MRVFGQSAVCQPALLRNRRTPAEELYQLRFQEITHPDDLPTSERLFARLARDGIAFQMEQRFIRGDGSLVWVAISVSVLRGRDGRPHTATRIDTRFNRT